MIHRRIVFTAFLLGFSQINFTFALTVDEAYRAIPHKRTEFSPKHAKMSYVHSAYLQNYFALVNEAVVQRVDTLTWFQSSGKTGQSYEAYHRNIQKVLNALQQLNVPDELKLVSQRTVEAIQTQDRYFAGTIAGNPKLVGFTLNAGDQNIQRSHQLLIEAWKELGMRFPDQHQIIRDAFFDHLCALDFI